jgi:ABC-type sugar transport system ATPase subunit
MEAIFNIEHISKSFPGVKALNDVSIEIQRGSVHALVGENGAGKSTLIKILAGIFRADEGKILLNGKELHFRRPIEAQRAGISVIHQELKLSETLTVAENIFLGNLMYSKRLHLVDWKSMRKSASEMLANLAVDLDVDAIAGTLSVAKKQIVEICKSISRAAQVIIMDEPSATLTDRELKVLFETIRNLRIKGYTIIYISHRLDEIFGLADNVTILRDGCHVTTLPIKEVTRDRLISMMVGRELEGDYTRHHSGVSEEIILEARNIRRAKVLQNVSLKVRKGEVLGISGLVGSGRTELARAILGIDKIDSGEILFKGRTVKRDFHWAIQHGMGLIPEDRKLQGLVLSASVKRNITMVAMNKIIKGGIVRSSVEEAFARRYIDMLKINTPSSEKEVQDLSGGNQQKVVIAKWLMQNSEVLFLDEPTRGVDVGAKREIYKIINDIVEQGKTVVVISSEMAELIGICDRIVVLCRGKLVGEFQFGDATPEKILALCV